MIFPGCRGGHQVWYGGVVVSCSESTATGSTVDRGPALEDRVAGALGELAAGRPGVVAEDPGRENEIDFVVPAAGISPELVGLLVRHGSGLICAAMPVERARALRLPPQVAENEDFKGTAYTVLCDARWPDDGLVHTGISAADRARPLRVLPDPAATPAALTRPRHV